MSERLVGWAGLCLFVAGAAAVFVMLALPVAAEEPLQSTNYRFEESVLGGGGLDQSNSATYQFTSSIGENATGAASSTNYGVLAGNKTSPDPVLGFAVTNSNVNFGDFSPTVISTAEATFAVSNYTSYGYVVHITGDTPKNGTKSIPAMGASGPDAPEALSPPGIEQFGLNLVANTDPTSLGDNPDQGQFGFGVATSLYNQSDKYRFASGEAIATAPKSSGITNYTISYVVNVNALTPGGQYTASQTLICTGTF